MYNPQLNNTSSPSGAATHIDCHSNHTAVGDAHHRVFAPFNEGYPVDIPIDLITKDKDGLTHLVCPGYVLDDPCPECDRPHHAGCIVIAVDGMCPNNGKNKSLIFSSAGVYVGAGSDLNGGYTLVDRGATNQKAELQAGIKGFETALRMGSEDLQGADRISTLVIKTDSTYLHDGATGRLKRWKQNGWRTSAKKDVSNQDLWKKLDAKIEEAESRGIRVLFWWVRRAYNKDADAWANFGYEAVKQYDVEKRLDEKFDGDVDRKYEEVQRLFARADAPFMRNGQGPLFPRQR